MPAIFYDEKCKLLVFDKRNQGKNLLSPTGLEPPLPSSHLLGDECLIVDSSKVRQLSGLIFHFMIKRYRLVHPSIGPQSTI